MAMVGKFPGVYPEITDLSQIVTSNSITSCAYVGEAEFGPINKPTLVTNLRGYINKFGELSSDYGYMGYSLAIAQDSINAHYIVRVVDKATARYGFTRILAEGQKDYSDFERQTWFDNYDISITDMEAINKDHNAAFTQMLEGSTVPIEDTKSIMMIAAENPNNKSYRVRITDSTINTNKNYKALSAKATQEGNITHVDITVPEMFQTVGKVTEQIFNIGDPITVSNAKGIDINGRFVISDIKNTYTANPDMNKVNQGRDSSLAAVSSNPDLVVTADKDIFEAEHVHSYDQSFSFVYVASEEESGELQGAWTLDGAEVDITSYGVIIMGEPLNDDKINVSYISQVYTERGTGYRKGNRVEIVGLHLENSMDNAIAYIDEVNEIGNVQKLYIEGSSDSTQEIETKIYDTINLDPLSNLGTGLRVYIEGTKKLNIVSYDIDKPVDIPAENPKIQEARIQKYPEDDETTFELGVYETVGKVTTLVEDYKYCTLYENKDSYGNSTFVEDVVNGKSNIINVYVNTANKNLRKVPQETLIIDPVTLRATGYSYLLLQNGTSGDKPDEDALKDAWSLYNDRSQTDVSLLMNSGYVRESNASYQQAMYNVAEKRRDCFCLFDIPSTLSDMEDVLDWRQNVNGMNTYRGALFTPWPLTYNSVLGKRNFVMCPSAYVAKIMGNAVYPWIAPAGPNRGTISSSVLTPTGLSAYYDDTEGGELYDKQLNCFIKDTIGYANWGQKTLQQKPSALDRINVARTVIYIEKTLREAARLHLFENNTAYERMQVTLQFSQFLDTVLNAEGIQRYQVICDETNNTPYIIAQNQLVIDVYLWPTYTTEFIQLNSIIMGPDADITVTTNS